MVELDNSTDSIKSEGLVNNLVFCASFYVTVEKFGVYDDDDG